MYPNYCAYDILLQFFETYATWKWPNPVILKPIVDHGFNLKVWDPKINPGDKYHKMPVITPAYPSMCSTHNVTQSTSELIIEEMDRAREIMKRNGDFDELFKCTDFFRRHKLYLEIRISARTHEDCLMWKGYVESKVRLLAMKIEGTEKVQAAIPFPKAFKCTETETEKDSDSVKDNANLNVKDGSTSDKKVHLNEPESKKMRLNDSDSAKNNSDGAPFINNNNGSPSINNNNDSPSINNNNDSPSIKNDSTTLINETFPPVKNDYSLERDRVSVNVFFIALKLAVNKAAEKKLYLSGPIEEFIELANGWEKRRPGMKIEVNARKKREIQEFLKGLEEVEE